MPIAVALEKLLGSVDPEQRPAVETRPLTEVVGMTLATPVCSPVNVPPHDNSAMDGYAVRFADCADGAVMNVSQRIPAGVAPAPLAPGTAARIFTGAPVPPDADTVIMQEDCEPLDDTRIHINERPRQHANIRRAGEDIREGQEIIAAGQRLDAAHVGLIASVGLDRVSVYRPLRVAVLVSGDELLEPGEPPQPGKIYNSNQYMLVPLLRQLGFEVSRQSSVADTFAGTVAALEDAAAHADVVISTGGVSVGEEDHLKPAVEALGQLALWKVNIKPGKPFAFGSLSRQGREVPFIGLPGNPVSVFATLLVLAVPYLRALQGQQWRPPVPVPVPAGFTMKKSGRRDEYLRVQLRDSDSAPVLERFPNQGSGVLSSVAWADGFAFVRAGTVYKAGDSVPYVSIAQMLHG
jgi:molybdopterin molybdotransferase